MKVIFLKSRYAKTIVILDTSTMSAHTSESSGTQDLSLSSQSQPNRRSKVWQYFEPNLVAVDDNLKAVCKYCGLHLSTKSGTSSLRTHISEYCPAIDDASRKEFISKKSLKSSGQVGEGLVHQNLKSIPTSKKNMWQTTRVLIFWYGGRHMLKSIPCFQLWHEISLQFLSALYLLNLPLVLEVGYLERQGVH